MRLAELLMAIVMGVFSLYLMWKSAELPVGWIPDEGPGGGAWPFWLSFIMLLCCLWIIVQWVRKRSPLSQSTEVYVERGVLTDVGLVAGSLTITIFLFHIVGIYVALPLFIVFYVRFLGKHDWVTTIATAYLVPVVTYLFFEFALKITLPKGYTDPFFTSIYAQIYNMEPIDFAIFAAQLMIFPALLIIYSIYTRKTRSANTGNSD